jgi:hypothetical protein
MKREIIAKDNLSFFLSRDQILVLLEEQTKMQSTPLVSIFNFCWNPSFEPGQSQLTGWQASVPLSA